MIDPMDAKLLSILGLAAGALACSAQVIVRVEVDGVPASYDGTPPQIVDGRVLVPVRGVFEQMGAEVTWDEEQKVVTATRGGHRIWMRIGDPTAMRDEVPVILQVPPQVLEGRTLVPLRFVGEALGVQVHWNGLEKIVTIETGGSRGALLRQLFTGNRSGSRGPSERPRSANAEQGSLLSGPSYLWPQSDRRLGR